MAARAAAVEGVDLAEVSGSGPAGRITKSDVLSAAAAGDGARGAGAVATNGKSATAAEPSSPADEGRRRGAGPLHGGVALDTHRHELPHADGERARRAPARAEGGGTEGVVHPRDRVRDRARRGGHAGDGQSLRRDRRQAPPRPRRTGESRAGGGRGEEGRLSHADGAGDRRRGAPSVRPLPRRLRRAGGEGAHEHAHHRRSGGRQHHPHQPRRAGHGRIGPSADERPGHDRGDRLDRLPGGRGKHRREHRRREGHDDDLDLRPPHHPGRASRAASSRASRNTCRASTASTRSCSPRWASI